MPDNRACIEVAPDTMIGLRGSLQFMLDRDWSDGDDASSDNLKRAGFAGTALAQFHDRTSNNGQEQVSTVFGDLLCDLHHLADALGIDWDDLVALGNRHYTQETWPPT